MLIYKLQHANSTKSFASLRRFAQDIMRMCPCEFVCSFSHRARLQPSSGFSHTGFTLLEAVIAIFIITLGIVGVLQMFPLSIQTQKLAEMATVASQLAQEKIEDITSHSFADVQGEPTTTLDSPFQAYSRTVEVSCYDPNGSSLTPNCPDTGIKKVTVVISWKSPLGTHEENFKIATLISKR